MSNTKQQPPHYDQSTSLPTRGILQKSYDYEAHETPEHKLKWDEKKLKVTEKQKEHVQMKVDEPNTPYIRYDPVTDQVTNWQDIPENMRKSAQEEPEDFSLDSSGGSNEQEDNSGGKISFGGSAPIAQHTRSSSSEWDKVDEQEKRDKEEAARKHHEAFEKKRAQHYYHAGDVLHEKLDFDDVEED